MLCLTVLQRLKATEASHDSPNTQEVSPVLCMKHRTIAAQIPDHTDDVRAPGIILTPSCQTTH